VYSVAGGASDRHHKAEGNCDSAIGRSAAAPLAGGRCGLAAQAVALVCRWAFAAHGLKQVTLQTYAGNVRSQRLAERLGFRRLPPVVTDGVDGDKRVWYGLNHGSGPSSADEVSHDACT